MRKGAWPHRRGQWEYEDLLFLWLYDLFDTIILVEAISNSHSNFLLNAIKDKIKSMKFNDVWDLVEFLEDSRPTGCK